MSGGEQGGGERVRLGYVTGLLSGLSRLGIERRLAWQRHGNRSRSESESAEPAATDFHPRKNTGERVVITPTRGQCVPIREGGEQRVAVNVNSWVTPEFSHFLWLIPERQQPGVV